MTSALDRQAPSPAVASLAVRARDVIGSEWIKFRSVRSTYWTLLVAALTPIVISLLVAITFTIGPKARRSLTNPMLPSFVSLEYAVIAIGVLGVLMFTGEYSSGLVNTTFISVPRRWAVLGAKAVVLGVATLVVGELVAFVSFFEVQGVLSRYHLGVSLSQPGVPGAVLATGVLLCVVSLIGLGVGSIVRHTAGGIAAVLALIFVPTLLAVLPTPWNYRLDRFTVFYAADQVTQLHPSTNLFAPALSMVVLVAWPAAALITAAFVIRRRDA
jgi:ABC-2 type transport system permease protein